MVQLSCGGRSFECPPGASVLETLTANGVAVSFGCRKGVCQSCLVRAVAGPVPESAQRGLAPALRARGYFLACSCEPGADLEVAVGDAALQRFEVEVVGSERLDAGMLCLRLRPQLSYSYLAGQFLRLFRAQGVSRCYSIASVPSLDDAIELHVKHVPQGKVSSWLHETIGCGDSIQISEPLGQCHYIATDANQPLLLIGTGSGLAPLYGIVRDALNRGHRGPVRLYHGSRGAEGLYRVRELEQLAQQHPNFSYVPCVSGTQSGLPSWATAGRALERALADSPALSGWRVFVCGNPAMVESARRDVYMAGASLGAIHADPFTAS